MTMKTHLKQSLYLAIVLILISIPLAACAGTPPEGQIKAKIVRGDQTLKKFPLVLIRLEGEGTPSMDEVRGARIITASTNDSGILQAEDMLPGTYMLALISFPEGILNLVYNDGEIFFFELPEGEGINLGTVDVSETTPVSN
jgi:hypothetical protein